MKESKKEYYKSKKDRKSRSITPNHIPSKYYTTKHNNNKNKYNKLSKMYMEATRTCSVYINNLRGLISPRFYVTLFILISIM